MVRRDIQRWQGSRASFCVLGLTNTFNLFFWQVYFSPYNQKKVLIVENSKVISGSDDTITWNQPLSVTADWRSSGIPDSVVEGKFAGAFIRPQFSDPILSPLYLVPSKEIDMTKICLQTYRANLFVPTWNKYDSMQSTNRRRDNNGLSQGGIQKFSGAAKLTWGDSTSIYYVFTPYSADCVGVMRVKPNPNFDPNPNPNFDPNPNADLDPDP